MRGGDQRKIRVVLRVNIIILKNIIYQSDRDRDRERECECDRDRYEKIYIYNVISDY